MKLFLKQEKEGIFMAAWHGFYRGRREKGAFTQVEKFTLNRKTIGKGNGAIMDINEVRRVDRVFF